MQIERVSDGLVVLREVGRRWGADGSAALDFASDPSESIFGFGEHQQGNLNNKGVSYDMEQCLDYGHSRGGEVCLPFIIGATGGAGRAACRAGPAVGCYQDSARRILPGQGGATNKTLLGAPL